MIVLQLDRVLAARKIRSRDLSRIVGISEVNISRIKTGKVSAIRFSTLDALCRALDCQPGDLLEYVPDDGAFDGDRGTAGGSQDADTDG